MLHYVYFSTIRKNRMKQMEVPQIDDDGQTLFVVQLLGSPLFGWAGPIICGHLPFSGQFCCWMLVDCQLSNWGTGPLFLTCFPRNRHQKVSSDLSGFRGGEQKLTRPPDVQAQSLGSQFYHIPLVRACHRDLCGNRLHLFVAEVSFLFFLRLFIYFEGDSAHTSESQRGAERRGRIPSRLRAVSPEPTMTDSNS